MRRIYTYSILILLVALTSSVSAQIGQIQNLGEHIEKGKIRLKLKQEVFQQSIGLKSLDVTSATETRIGVTSIDRIGDQIGITRIKRVFPFSLKDEAKHREYGLHLWLEVEFDSQVDVEYAVELYANSAEIDIAKPLFKKVRLDGDQEPVKYKAGKLQLINEAPVQQSVLKSTNEEFEAPNDPLFGQQWHYETNLEKYENGKDIELLKAWSISSGDSSVIVAIVDGGIDVNHEDLSKHIWINEAELNGEDGVDDDQNGYVDDINGYNFVFSGQVTPHGHGTHVAGTVGAVNNNGIGVAGVAGGGVTHTDEDGKKYTDNGVRMISCQVFDNRSSTSGNFAAAIVYGADNGAVISQNSWGYTVPNYYEPEVYDAINYFIAEAGQYEGSPMKGGILFFAAGNDGLEQTHYPATFEEVVAVTSLGPEGYAAPYTNYGEWTDIAAPGGDQVWYEQEGGVLSTLPYNEYGFYQGTSMACPHVSGVAALVLTKYGGDEMTPDELRNRVVNSTKRFVFEHQNKYGSGMLNAPNALANDEKLPPEAIDDLEATEIYHQEVRLQWTIPVDPDNFQPSYIYLALSGSEITADNFDLKPQIVFENPFDAGTQVQVNIGGLIKHTDYWFAMKSEDQFGNISEISNIIDITTTDSPQFELSKNTINLNIDVATGTTYSEMIQLSNVGEGILYWENYVENERFYWEEEEEEEAPTTSIQKELSAKLNYAESNPQLFEVPVNPQTQVLTLKSGEIVTKPTDYWDYDKTVFTSGMSYENGKDAASLLSTYNTNAGLIQATRFNVDYDYTFNLTHLEVAMYTNTNEKPIIVELRKGSTRIEEAELVYLQEYYSDTTEVFGFQRIPLYQPQRFEDGEVFWVILHFPKEDEMPLGLAVDTFYPSVFLMSKDNGRSYFDLQTWRDGPFIPLVRALSTGDDGAYVFIKPGNGEVEAGDSQDVEVHIDATNLSEGKHLASVTLLTNDMDKAYVSMEVNVNVSGQAASVDTMTVHDFKVLQNIEDKHVLELKNLGLANLEVYDIFSDATGFAKDFTDTVTVYVDYTDEVPFTYTPTHLGVLETKIRLKTNHGIIGIPVKMNSTAPAGMDASISNAVLDLAYGETGTISLDVTNNGIGSDLEFDLSHYSMLNKAKATMPDALSYQLITSEDVGGPVAGTWEDISEIGAVYDEISVWEDTLQLGSRVPFFNEVMETAWHGFEGVIYFYETWENGVQLPAEYPSSVGLGAMAPLLFSDSSTYFPIKEFIFYSYGDRNIFTITVHERIAGDPNAETDEMTYQVVLYRDGTVEYRYKDVSALTPDMKYVVALHGFTSEDYVVYKNLDETGKDVYDGLVVRFEPRSDASMILNSTPEKAYLEANESTTVQLSIDPSMYDVYAGSYENTLVINANTATGQVQLPFTINITGLEAFEAVDTLRFETTNLGHASQQLLKVDNTGSDKGQVTSITFSNNAFSSSVSLPFAIQPMAHELLPVIFEPTVVGDATSTVTLVYSNGASESVRLEAKGQVDPQYTHTIPSDITLNVMAGEVSELPFSLTASASGANLEYSYVNSHYAGVYHQTTINGSKENSVKKDGLYGYTWATDSISVFYKWESIINDGDVLDIKSGKQHAIELPFDFPFYGEVYDSIWISKNGYVTVFEPSGEPFSLEFEVNDGLAGMIAPFWSPLVAANEGEGVMLKTHEDRVVIEWNNYRGEEGSGSGGNISFQLELLADGRIYFHYNSLQYFEGLQQYGLESPDESEVLNKPKTWILPWTDLEDERSMMIAPPLKSSLNSGVSSDFNMLVDGNRFYKSGSYRDTVTLLSNSSAQSELDIPVLINFAGKPKVSVTEQLSWNEVVYKKDVTVRDGFEMTNTGSDIATITYIKTNQLAEIALVDENGDQVSIASTGKLINPIEIKPWEVKQFELIVLVDEFANVDGQVNIEGDFGVVSMGVDIEVVESPVFDWTATHQTFNLNASEGGSYSFEVENLGETTLNFELVPAVVPSSNNNGGSAIIDEVGNYTFDLPNVVDSMAIDTKNTADGLFTPIAGGAILSFCNEFVAPEGGFFITHVKAWTYLKQLDQYVNVMIYVGGDEATEENKNDVPQTGTKVYEQNYLLDQQTEGQWVVYPLAEPVSIPAGERFYVMVAPPIDKSFIGYDVNTNQQLQEQTYVGVYWADGIYKWYSTANESWDNSIYKVRPLTAAGKNQWIELDQYSGEAAQGESVGITATFDANLSGPGKHKAKLIVKSNDVNRANDQVDITINVNGAPEVVYHPNQEVDTLQVREWDELVVNMMASDPEGEALSFDLEENNDNPELEMTTLNNHSIQLKLRTDYDGQGLYTYHVNISDVAGNTTRDSVLIEVLDKNRAPILDPDLGIIYLNMADPKQGYTIDGNELFTDPDGDALQILAGNYTPEIVDLALGERFITINPLQEGTGFLAFAADDGKEGGFVVYGVYVVIINDPDAVDGSPDFIGHAPEKMDDLLIVTPNPLVNPQAKVWFDVQEEGEVVLDIFDLRGVKCATSLVGDRQEGVFGEEINVSKLSNGVYFCRYSLNGQMKATVKIVVNK
ncbi:S8 family serine peptidase [Carboxylicivirga sp. M1479]|uniref:S8 family serine peptidase n=1 Tax=Carboxylicivirga sp. M1479 TaxID=2594476 RepID=UPI0011781668|nr:S8 family serine peptidase [Carboxylicivirga sp. M1479]TRX71758.1 S8 family serine peptidase [Carboxylicivirga sp. M1479]